MIISRRKRALRALRALIATVLAVSAGMLTAVLPAAATPPYTASITGSGSTWVYPAISQWISDVQQNGMNISYNPDGSSDGRADFGQGQVDFGASEIPYGVQDGTNFDPPPKRGYAYMPDAAGGTTFMYNLTVGTQRITDLRLSDSVIAQIFTGVITNWDDPQIAADNPGLNLPSLQIVPVVRSDGAGSTADFTAWMLATEPSWWQKYCALPQINWNPCTATSTYPVGSDPAMKSQVGDGGVAGYVDQAGSNGSIGYTEFAYAKEAGFPVALLLNAAGYYTEPTPGNIAVSLLAAQINMDTSSPDYLTENLSGVYTDTDPRTYELSAYSYMILPTDTSNNFSNAKGNTLGDFGQYLLCHGQTEVDSLGYSALPINLVEAGYAQLAKIPGNTVPTVTTSIVAGCDNPTFSTNGTNTLADTDPDPPACDKQGATMCTAATGGAAPSASPSASASGSTSTGSSGSTSTGSTGSTSTGSTGSTSTSGKGSTGTGSTGKGSTGTGSTGTGSTGTGSTGTGSTGTGSTGPGSSGTGSTGTGSTSTGSTGTSSGQNCDASTGICSGGSTTTGGTSSTGVESDTGAQSSGDQQVDAVPVASPSSLGNGVRLALMVLAAALLIGLGLAPALIGQAGNRRQKRHGAGPYGPGD